MSKGKQMKTKVFVCIIVPLSNNIQWIALCLQTIVKKTCRSIFDDYMGIINGKTTNGKKFELQLGKDELLIRFSGGMQLARKYIIGYLPIRHFSKILCAKHKTFIAIVQSRDDEKTK